MFVIFVFLNFSRRKIKTEITNRKTANIKAIIENNFFTWQDYCSVLALSSFLSFSTRYIGFVSRLAQTPSISIEPSQMEPRSPSLLPPTSIGDLPPVFVISHIADVSILYFARTLECGKQRTDYSEEVRNNNSSSSNEHTTESVEAYGLSVRSWTTAAAIGGVCNDQLRELRVIN